MSILSKLKMQFTNRFFFIGLLLIRATALQAQEIPVLSLRWNDPSLRYIYQAKPRVTKYDISDSAFYFLYLNINRRIEDYILFKGIIEDENLRCPKWQFEDVNTHVFKLHFRQLNDFRLDSPARQFNCFYEVTILDSGYRYNAVSGNIYDVHNYERAIVSDEYDEEYKRLIGGLRVLIYYNGTDVYFIAGDCIRDTDFSWAILGDRFSFRTPEWYIKIKALLYYTMEISEEKLNFLFTDENYAVFEHGKHIISLYFGLQPTFKLNQVVVKKRQGIFRID